MVRVIVLLLTCLVQAPPARAEMPSGHDDPRFQAAVEAWLADDPEATCPLYAMIEAGHDAAVMFYLGLDDAGHLSGDKACTKSGVSTYLNSFWREDAEERSQLLADWSPWPPSPAALERLIAAGEPRRALALLANWRSHPEVDARTLLNVVSPVANPDMPADLHHFMLALYSLYNSPTGTDAVFDPEQWQRWIYAACHAQATTERPFAPLEAFCFPKDQQDALLFHHTFYSTGQATTPNRHSDSLLRWLETDWRTEPYRKICGEVCPLSPRACLLPLFNHAGGGVIFFGMRTPSERLISQRRYLASERAAGGFWRSQSFQIDYFPNWPQRLRESSPDAACLADALEQRQTRWDRIKDRE